MDIRSKQSPFRVIGQRSITSSFLSRSSNPFKVVQEDSKDDALEKKSLSDFLTQRLHRSSEQPKTGKSKPFSSFLGLRGSSGSIDGNVEPKKPDEVKTDGEIDKVVLQQFKHTGSETEHCLSSSTGDEAEDCESPELQLSRKRKTFEGRNEQHSAQKNCIVFGGGLKPKQQRTEKSSVRKERSRPFYNHYANGCGWWDCDMEGIDNEEVGFSEVWEGMGSTTFGEVTDWH